MKIKRFAALLLALSLLCVPPAAAADNQTSLWMRTEGNGDYVTVRVPFPEGEELGWAWTRYAVVYYADTGEPVALTGEYFRDGHVFATVPAAQAERELKVEIGQPARFRDCVTVWEGNEYYDAPGGTDQLNLRGIILGDDAGNLNADAVITRAEAFTLMVRLLSLKPVGDPGYGDVQEQDWYYDTVSAARAGGIAAEDVCFNPNRPVTRGEITVMLYRAMKSVGWLEQPETKEELFAADAEAVPDWAYDAYQAFGARNLGIFTYRDTDELDNEGIPLQTAWAEQDKGATRGEIIELLYNTLRFLPVCPTQVAIDYGFDENMPVIDGSTSTYPYTQAVYGRLFGNYTGHEQFPARHSKSYYSYERLINGEADILFASTKPTEDTLARAKAAGVELELIPIAHDAMVFFTNGDNSMDNLTMEQIRSIYVDNAYTNWDQLGGPDAFFVPYCRNADSGSQAQMEEFFLKGDVIHPDIRRETTSVSMASVLTDVEGAYCEDPLTYALGYSIYYYYGAASQVLLSDMDALRLLSVDGVFPTDETIADGSYPLAGYNYAVIRADAAENSPARRMVRFMLSEVGQQCVADAGFGPVRTP